VQFVLDSVHGPVAAFENSGMTTLVSGCALESRAAGLAGDGGASRATGGGLVQDNGASAIGEGKRGWLRGLG